jgi:uncharacterized membrane protein YdcZ (DUF606 family)
MGWIFATLAFIAGVSVALQPLSNAMAANQMGHPLWGALVSATGTFLVLIIIVAALHACSGRAVCLEVSY